MPIVWTPANCGLKASKYVISMGLPQPVLCILEASEGCVWDGALHY